MHTQNWALRSLDRVTYRALSNDRKKKKKFYNLALSPPGSFSASSLSSLFEIFPLDSTEDPQVSRCLPCEWLLENQSDGMKSRLSCMRLPSALLNANSAKLLLAL